MAKKRGKMDRKLVSQQEHEIRHVAEKTKKPRAIVRKVQKSVGRSRKKVEAALD